MAMHADDCNWNSAEGCDCGADELEMCDMILAYVHEDGWDTGIEAICQIKRKLASLVAHRPRGPGLDEEWEAKTPF